MNGVRFLFVSFTLTLYKRADYHIRVISFSLSIYFFLMCSATVHNRHTHTFGNKCRLFGSFGWYSNKYSNNYRRSGCARWRHIPSSPNICLIVHWSSYSSKETCHRQRAQASVKYLFPISLMWFWRFLHVVTKCDYNAIDIKIAAYLFWHFVFSSPFYFTARFFCHSSRFQSSWYFFSHDSSSGRGEFCVIYCFNLNVISTQSQTCYVRLRCCCSFDDKLRVSLLIQRLN